VVVAAIRPTHERDVHHVVGTIGVLTSWSGEDGFDPEGTRQGGMTHDVQRAAVSRPRIQMGLERKEVRQRGVPLEKVGHALPGLGADELGDEKNQAHGVVESRERDALYASRTDGRGARRPAALRSFTSGCSSPKASGAPV